MEMRSNPCDTERRTVKRRWIILSTYGRKWQLLEDVIHRTNVEYRAWGALKSVLSNRGLGIKAYLYQRRFTELSHGV